MNHHYPDILKAVNKAKLTLFTQRNSTFFSSLIANLKIIIKEDFPARAATDGLSIVFRADFARSLSTPGYIFVMLHEVMHCVYQHMNVALKHDLDKQLWNKAGDYLINGELDKLGYELVDDILLDHQYDNMSTKEIYDLLLQNPPQSSSLDGDLIFETPKGMTAEEHKEVVLGNVIKAVIQAKLSNDIGSIPGDLARKIDDLVNPKLPWHQILQNYMSSYAKEEYTWSRPNRRFMPDFYLPSMHSESLNQITVAIDVSGSVGQNELDAFMAEVRYIWDIMKPKKLRLLGFDTKIHDDLEFTEGDSIDDVTLHGGGGTHIGPIIETIEEDQPEVSIIITDGEFSMPYMNNVTSDVLWVICNRESFTFKPSKGEVIRMENE